MGEFTQILTSLSLAHLNDVIDNSDFYATKHREVWLSKWDNSMLEVSKSWPLPNNKSVVTGQVIPNRFSNFGGRSKL